MAKQMMEASKKGKRLTREEEQHQARQKTHHSKLVY